MTDVVLTFEVSVDAPVHTVFEYCRDPRRIYAGDPMYTATDATVTVEGVGTRAHLVTGPGAFSEDVAIEYVELVPDRRIVFDAHPDVTLAVLGRHTITGSVHRWTWTFTPEAGGTHLAVAVVEQDAPRWERVMDLLTVRTMTRMFCKQVRGRLARIKAAAEEQSAAAR